MSTNRVVYGPETTATGIRLFLRGFQKDTPGNNAYFKEIERMVAKGQYVLAVDYADLKEYAEKQVDEAHRFAVKHMMAMLLSKPTSTIEIFRKQVVELLKEIHAVSLDYEAIEKQTYVRFYNLDSSAVMDMSAMRPEHIGRLVQMDGSVSRIEKARAHPIRQAYRCTKCNGITMSPHSYHLSHIQPDQCSKCKAGKTAMYPEEAESENVSFKRITMQPLHEKLDVANAADDIRCFLYGDDMMDVAGPGESVRVVGIVMAKPVSETNKAVNSLCEYYLQANSIHALRDEDIKEDDVDEELVKDTVKKETEDKDFEKLVMSICPSHYGDRDVKLALLLLLVGSEPKVFRDGTKLRGEINVLLTSSPGGGKSQFFNFEKRLFKKTQYTAGKGASAVGLTVTVRRDEEGVAGIDAGAYMRGDLVIVDELDKVRNEDKDSMATIMDDQQTLYLNKMGINREWNLRVASLHGANPVGGKWNSSKSFVENIPFAHWILDRYDLKFVILNEPSEVADKERASHFGKMLMQSASEKQVKAKRGALVPVEGTYSATYLRVWAQYCRKHFDPTVSEEAIGMMTDFYLKLRKDRGTQDISMREIGNIYRLSVASARAHMRNEVLPKDVNLATELIMASMLSCGIDPETGEVSYIHTTSAMIDSKAKRHAQFREVVERLAGKELNMVKEEDIRKAMYDLGYKDRQTQEIIDDYIAQARFYCPKQGYVQIIYNMWIKK